MGYGRYVGRVGALAVALGIGAAIANGGVANATEDAGSPDGSSQTGEQNSNPPETNTPDTDPNPSTATTVGDEQKTSNDTDGRTRKQPRPRVMILDALHGANVLGARRSTAQDRGPLKQKEPTQQKQQAVDESSGGAAVDKFSAPPVPVSSKPALPTVRVFHRTLNAITPPPVHNTPAIPQLRTTPAPSAPVIDTLTTQTKRQAAAVSDPSTLAAPPVTPVTPKPGQALISLLSSIGLRPDAFPPSSPLAPIGQVLEFVYAGLRRFDHTFFNETPTATPLIIDTDEKTGVVTGRVATDYEGDSLAYKVIDAPDDGEVVFNPDGTFTYTPDRNQTHAVGETDEFTVAVSDRTNFHLHLFSSTAHTVTVTVSDIPVIPNNTVIDTIDDEGATVQRPEDLAINHDGTKVYVTDSDADKVHVIDTATNTIIKSIPVSPGPDGLAVVKTQDNKEYVYVASSRGVLGDPMNPSDDIVSVIDTSTDTVVATINLSPSVPMPIVAGLQQVAASPDGTKVYVTGFDGVFTIDTASNTVTTFVSLQDDPLDSNRYDIAVTPNGQFAYAPDYHNIGQDGADINVINLGTGGVAKIDAAPDQNIEDVVISPDGRYVYMTGESLIVLDTSTNTIVARNTTIGDGRGLAISPDGSRLYVTQINSDLVTVVDTATLEVVGSVPVESAWNVAITPDGTRAYVVGFATPGVSVIALQTPTDPAIVV